MKLARIKGENFRLFERFEIEPQPRLNFVVGPNAAGKTSLLEAIYCLGRVRSFRGPNAQDIAGAGGAHWRVGGRLSVDGRPGQDVAVHWSRTATEVRIGAERGVTVAELVRDFPVQIIEPGAHRLLEEGPGYRRRYLDWGVFHVEHSFFPAWRRYQRALQQRNRCLKEGRPDTEVRAWDAELAQAGEEVHALRAAHLPQLRERIRPLLRKLLGIEDWSLELARGWSQEQALAESLVSHLARDRRLGQTMEGPHRAELRLKLHGHTVKNRVSRGQQKLLVAALVLAQAGMIGQASGRPPVLLVDDYPAELGAEFQQALLEALRDSGSQVFLSALERGMAQADVSRDAMFHVEHGRVERD
ncbi:MAG: DNA replication/repair protein RecF [Gammaproteobacteria bacterium]|nr:DNA replication/repair protein RecF [Gammaproteobacteria bacterium]